MRKRRIEKKIAERTGSHRKSGKEKKKDLVKIKKRDDFPERGIGSKRDYEKNNEGFRM
ncbi:hypothetical protein [Suipraeoptans intestinalis]|uniref:hypothetical protein n=1 Tax=Suipraeoptans intestinalis TaxID=2606628 RepID=UPI002A7620F8|nr:hypothetical protein [Suipraeoptans intestinalis]MDY3121792.1 hypothetical protein [Suipraeoptans intestinalis]